MGILQNSHCFLNIKELTPEGSPINGKRVLKENKPSRSREDHTREIYMYKKCKQNKNKNKTLTRAELQLNTRKFILEINKAIESLNCPY